RMILGSAGFALVAVISLALGIGANTTIFSLVNTLLLKPLPVDQPNELVAIFNKGLGENEAFHSNSYPEFLDMAARNTVFSGVSCSSFIPLGLKGDQGEASIILGQMVSTNFFDVVGVPPILGRNFVPAEGESEGTHPVVMMSEELWQGRFAGDESIIGQSLMLNGYPFTVIGIVPDSFEGMNIGIEPELWVPLMMHKYVATFEFDLNTRGNNFLRCMARLKPGMSLEQARADMEVFAANLEATYPDSEKDCAYTLIPANDDRILVQLTNGRGINGLMIVLMSVVGLVLLIACSNVASILLARASARQKEIAIRLAMGAGQGRVIRQLLTESMVLAILAGGTGILLAYWTISLIHGIDVPVFDTFPIDFSLDRNVLLFTLGVTVVTGFLFGLVPAVQIMRTNVVATLKDQGSSISQTAGKSRMQGLLVISQLAMSLFLLVMAGMFVRSLQNAEHLDVGFDPSHNAVLSINLGLGQYQEESGARFYDDLLRQVREMPGVVAAGYADSQPFGFNRSSTTVSIPGYEPREDESMNMNRATASDGYFKAMGIPILEGREFEPTDDEDGELVMVINEVMADRYFPDREPIGSIVRLWGEDRRVVGVAKTGMYHSLRETPQTFLYIPQAQDYAPWQNLHIRTEADPKAMLAPAMKLVHEMDPNLPLFSVETMEHNMGFALLPARIVGSLVSMFGLIALILAVTGVYGVMAYSVSQRTNEFGIRMAIGAQQRDVLKLVLKKGMIISIVGMSLGLILALGAGLGLSRLNLLYGVS
ncbi:MAG: ABC transporter permease, partial [Planctomycetes bacterium]|nr:ABC transporter permease [Planctomycetota bacterium]